MTSEFHPKSANTLAAPAPRRRSRLLIAGAALGLALIGAGSVYAQWDGPRRGMERGGMERERMGGGPRGEEMRLMRLARFCAADTARYQPVARLFLKADLRLNKDQETSFDALADTLLPTLDALKKEYCEVALKKPATAPERLAAFATILRKAADAAEKTAPPMNAFYAKLDDTQKARVEELLARARRHGPMGRMMGGPMREEMGGPMGGFMDYFGMPQR